MNWQIFTRFRRFFLYPFLVLLLGVVLYVVFTKGRRPKATVPDLKLSPTDISNAAELFADKSVKVIIVGAGAAGMFAAYTLAYLGVDFVILEANAENFGGRVQEIGKDDFVDVPLDLGAEWIHVHPQILQDLLLFPADKAAVDIETIAYEPQTLSIFQDGKMRRRDWYRFFYGETKFYNTTWHSYLNTYVYPHIADQMQLDAVVEEINYAQTIDGESSNGQAVTVRTKDGRIFTGSHVIVATPVTILQQGDIVFDPPLSTSKQQELQSVYMPAGLKVWIEFDERFYPDFVSPTGGILTGNFDKLFLDALFQKPSNRNVLLLFQVGGNEAEERVQMDDETLIANVLSELDRIFQGKATEHYVQHRIMNWSKEPFIKGAYSMNYDFDKNKLLQPEGDNRIYFCGEYVAGWEQSTVHGAGISGRTVAQQLLLDALQA